MITSPARDAEHSSARKDDAYAAGGGSKDYTQNARARIPEKHRAHQGKQFGNNLRPCFVNMVVLSVDSSPTIVSLALFVLIIDPSGVSVCKNVFVYYVNGKRSQKADAEVQSPHPSLHTHCP